MICHRMKVDIKGVLPEASPALTQLAELASELQLISLVEPYTVLTSLEESRISTDIGQLFKSCQISLKEGFDLDSEDDNDTIIHYSKFTEVLANLDLAMLP